MRIPALAAIFSAMLLAAAICRFAPGQDAAPRPPEALPTPDEMDIRWRDIVVRRDWEAGRKLFHSAIRSAAIQIVDPEALLTATDALYYRYRVCKYFPALSETFLNQQIRDRFIDWLLVNESLTKRLLSAIDQRDDPAKMFAVLYDLVSFDEKKVLEFPSLTVAFAVVHDRATYSPVKVREDFQHLTSRASDLRINPANLPPELARFLADNRTSSAEKTFVHGRRFQLTRLEEAYESIRIRPMTGVGPVGPPARMRLDEIMMLGGRLDDRTYFTIETARALGIPAANMKMQASTSEDFSWVGYLEITRQGWEWKEVAGPQADYVRMLPAVADIPSGSGYLTRSELQRLARLAGLDPMSQEGRKLHVARRLAELAETIAEPMDPAELLPGVRGRDPEGARAALRLVKESIQRDPISRRPWRILADIASRYPVDSRSALLELFLMLESPRQLPEIARDPHARIEAFIYLARGVDDLKAMEEMLTRMARAVRALPAEFTGRLELLVADRIGKDNPAVAYDRIKNFLDSNPMAGPVVLDLLDKLLELGRPLGRVDPTVNTFSNVYSRLPRPRNGPYAAWSLRYQAGRKLEALYVEIGRTREAAELQRTLNSMTP